MTRKKATSNPVKRIRNPISKKTNKKITKVNKRQGKEMEKALGPIKRQKSLLPVPTEHSLSKTMAAHLASKPIAPVDTAPHLIVIARAGTGKTTTLVEGLKLVKGLTSTLTPSPQQAAVWDCMKLSQGKVSTICFVAFNKSIADELRSRVPEGCDAMTMHSLGYRTLRRAYPSLGSPNSYRVQDIISELLETDIRDLRRTKPIVLKATEELVSLCKMNLVGTRLSDGHISNFEDCWKADLESLAVHYDIDLNGESREVFALVPRVLERCKDLRDNTIDYNDMIWLPIVLNLPITPYDMLLIDESQDLNRCQQALAKRAGRRLILCGDPKQSIYGFAGADVQSLPRLEAELRETSRGCNVLPLTVTRRCAKAIVTEAQKYVPDFQAFETNPQGKVSYAKMGSRYNPADTYAAIAQDGDMVLCRCNAPLVQECFGFLRRGRKAKIQGRDVGQGLINTIKKMKCCKDITDLATVPTICLIEDLDRYLSTETQKLQAKRNPDLNKIAAMQDRFDCLYVFCDGCETTAQVITKIESVFTDDKTNPGIKLSSVHKAKGLEAKRVFILLPKDAPMPHPMAKSAWEKEQEYNCLYIAITRAIEELVYVTE